MLSKYSVPLHASWMTPIIPRIISYDRTQVNFLDREYSCNYVCFLLAPAHDLLRVYTRCARYFSFPKELNREATEVEVG